jgi:hypothetical protein
MSRFGSTQTHDLKDVELSRSDKPISVPILRTFSEFEVRAIQSAFWIILVTFCVIALLSPEKVEHKEHIYPFSALRSEDQFLLFDLTAAQLVRFVCFDISAIRESSSFHLTVPFALFIDFTFKSQFEIVNESRHSLKQSLLFEPGNTYSTAFFTFSSALSDSDLIEGRFNFSANFSQLSAFAVRSSSGSANANLFLQVARLMFALFALAMAALFHVRVTLPRSGFWPWLLIACFAALPFSDRCVSAFLALAVRLCVVLECETAVKTRIGLSASFFLWAVLRELTDFGFVCWAVGAIAVCHVLYFFRFANEDDGRLLRHFGFVLACVAAFVDVVWRSFDTANRFQFGDLVFEAVSHTVGAMLVFALRPGDGLSGFEVLDGRASASANDATIVELEGE